MQNFLIFLKILGINILCAILVVITISGQMGGQLFGMNMAVFAIVFFLPPVMIILNTIMFLLAKFRYKLDTESIIYAIFAFFWGILMLNV